jgi:NADH-quinone oxidoreductase subunit J
MVFFGLFSNIIFHLILAFFLIHFFGLFVSYLVLHSFFSFIFTTFVPIFILSGVFFSFFSVSPINALLCILSSFIFSAVLLFSVGVEILTFIFLIVYLGALMMLFLFVIMLFNLQYIKQNSSLFYKYFIFFMFLLFLIFVEQYLLILTNFSMSP